MPLLCGPTVAPADVYNLSSEIRSQKFSAQAYSAAHNNFICLFIYSFLVVVRHSHWTKSRGKRDISLYVILIHSRSSQRRFMRHSDSRLRPQSIGPHIIILFPIVVLYRYCDFCRIGRAFRQNDRAQQSSGVNHYVIFNDFFSIVFILYYIMARYVLNLLSLQDTQKLVPVILFRTRRLEKNWYHRYHLN